jgi:hypothetical protein
MPFGIRPSNVRVCHFTTRAERRKIESGREESKVVFRNILPLPLNLNLKSQEEELEEEEAEEYEVKGPGFAFKFNR